MIMTAQLMTLGDIILQPFGISQLLEDVQCADAVEGRGTFIDGNQPRVVTAIYKQKSGCLK